MTTSMKIYIPEELRRHILASLPVISLIRFKSVCKSWNQIISSKSFCNFHIAHNKSSSNNKNKCILFNHKYMCTPNLIDTESCVDVDVQSSNRWSRLQSISQKRFIDVYGICNGLLCLSDPILTLKSNIYLWNPFVRRGRKLPSVTSCRAFGACGLASLAFGYYDDDDDYKVIRIARCGVIYVVHIYSLRSDQWEYLYLNLPNNIADEIHYKQWKRYSHAMLVNGLVYFEYRKARQLVCFDIGSKKIQVVDFPDQVNAHSRYIIKACGESIAFLDFEWMGGDDSDVVMWILQNRSGCRDKSIWERRFIVRLSRCYPMLGTLIDDNKVMVRMHDHPHECMLFDLETNRLKQLKFRQDFATSEQRITVWKMESFVESLVLLDERTICTHIMEEFANIFNTTTTFSVYIIL